MSRLRGHRDSFKFAFAGLETALKQEPNFQVHVVIAVLVLITAALLKFNTYEWLLTLFTIAYVIILELINTSLESIVDIVSPDKHPKAKVAKDVAASAVLVATILSIIVLFAMFIPKVILLLS